MMSNPWILLTALCLGSLVSLPRPARSQIDVPVHEALNCLEARMDTAWRKPPIKLHDPITRVSQPHGFHGYTWAVDEQDMVSLHAHSSDSLQGMTWILPKGIQALHLREGEAEIIEEPEHWRVIAGNVRRLSLHWQQPQG